MNELINHKAIYRTDPATPGLLNICQSNFKFLRDNVYLDVLISKLRQLIRIGEVS